MEKPEDHGITMGWTRVTEQQQPLLLRLPRWPGGKESTWKCRRHQRRMFDTWVGKIPWSRKWQPTPVFLPGKFHGQKSLVGYSPCSHRELDTADHAGTKGARALYYCLLLGLPPAWCCLNSTPGTRGVVFACFCTECLGLKPFGGVENIFLLIVV